MTDDYSPIFKWYEDHGGDLDDFDTIEDLVKDIENVMISQGKRKTPPGSKGMTEEQRIKNITGSSNFIAEPDIQKSIINKFSERLITPRLVQSSLDKIENELNSSKNTDLLSTSKRDILTLINERRNILDIEGIRKLKQDDIAYDSKTNTVFPDITKGRLKVYDLSKDLINRLRAGEKVP